MRFAILITMLLFFYSCKDRSFRFDEVDYCGMVEYKFRQRETSGGKGMSFIPSEGKLQPTEITAKQSLSWNYEIKKGKTKLQEFIHDHQRFDYIFGNRIGSPFKYAHLFPDTVKMNHLICSDLKQDKKFNQYFRQLSNIEVTEKEIFTWDEMMHVASRFFLTWQRNDSSFGGYICAAINGQKELKIQKDLTVLEAFAFEAIFHYLRREREPLFVQHFSRYQDSILKEEKNKNKDPGELLTTVKNETYEAMEKDAELKKILEEYYDIQKKNLGFIIKDIQPN